MTRKSLIKAASAIVGLALLAGCNVSDLNREAGFQVDDGSFGNSTMNNTLVMTGKVDATIALQQRFASEVPPTITFAFNSAELSPQAMTVLAKQAQWIRQFPEVRFKVFGHTDLVGSDAYNKSLGMRRARASVAFLVSQGIGSARLEAVVSYGKTRPVVQVAGPEEQNRRTVTEVAGFVSAHPNVLNGKYAEVVWREFIETGAVRAHPANSSVETSVAASE